MTDEDRVEDLRRDHPPGHWSREGRCRTCVALAQLDAVTAERDAVTQDMIAVLRDRLELAAERDALRREVEAWEAAARHTFNNSAATMYFTDLIMDRIRARVVATLTQPPAPTGATTKE